MTYVYTCDTCFEDIYTNNPNKSGTCGWCKPERKVDKVKPNAGNYNPYLKFAKTAGLGLIVDKRV